MTVLAWTRKNVSMCLILTITQDLELLEESILWETELDFRFANKSVSDYTVTSQFNRYPK